MTIEQIETMSASEFVGMYWGNNVLEAIQKQNTTPMSMEEFLNHCTACGGNWGAMLLTGIKALYPDVYDAIPDDMGHFAWRCICETLELLQIKGDEE